MITTTPSSPGDPFGIRTATATVLAETRNVLIDHEAITRVAREMVETWGDPPEWDDRLHYRGTPIDTAGWVLVLDTLNFCFWAQGDDPSVRWRVTWRGKTYNGYDALAAALHRAVVDDGIAVWDGSWLHVLTDADVRHLLRGDEGCPPIPLLDARIGNLRELGSVLEGRHAGELVAAAQGSAIRLVHTVVEQLPSFRDVARWERPGGETIEVAFLKRAQILAADVAGALAGTELAIADGLDQLTAFADYKVPQVLRQIGMLRYQPGLAARIHRLERIPAGSPEEVTIRAATVQACDLLVSEVQRLDRETTASEIDWRLWTLGQSLPGEAEPYHRTVTIFY